MSLKIKDIELFVELEDTDSQSVVSGGKGIQQSGIQQSGIQQSGIQQSGIQQSGIQQSGIQQSGSASGRNLSSSTSISI
ncbi:hypothetical protein [Microcystis aeruginosa]|uniref:hypothetical protein n=1 Tax=Microcystis aeruginosa TaxID=1126 RepID=UPI0012BA9672|nr:hypothetical protein [Microcystis aeruginosa]